MSVPIFTSRQMIKKLTKAGFYIDHQTGSHVILRNNKGNVTIRINISGFDLLDCQW